MAHPNTQEIYKKNTKTEKEKKLKKKKSNEN